MLTQPSTESAMLTQPSTESTMLTQPSTESAMLTQRSERQADPAQSTMAGPVRSCAAAARRRPGWPSRSILEIRGQKPPGEGVTRKRQLSSRANWLCCEPYPVPAVGTQPAMLSPVPDRYQPTTSPRPATISPIPAQDQPMASLIPAHYQPVPARRSPKARLAGG
ncbi:hypothetical protein ANANG_G00113590 [Anguilla anguilla]|uniref:Uncharacterized protein n=1 Tax=Anguilla anguilla TaxID=7936 RepID=A0A9D3RYQ2_ANGAN|nr:hypothetical protein ANANG_G00113590 [Anguilla anguilla]